MAEKRKPAKTRTPGEKASDFKALAGKHAGTALGAIARLGKLARPSRYSWTPEQIKILEKAFQDSLTNLFTVLKNPPQSGKAKNTKSIFE